MKINFSAKYPSAEYWNETRYHQLREFVEGESAAISPVSALRIKNVMLFGKQYLQDPDLRAAIRIQDKGRI